MKYSKDKFGDSLKAFLHVEIMASQFNHSVVKERDSEKE